MAAWFGIPRKAAGPVVAATLVLFGILAGHSILETARDALFLSALPASQLPIVYLAIAGFAFVVAAANRRLNLRFTRRGTLGVTLAGSALTSTVFWFWTGGGAASLYAFYVWTGLLATVAVVQLWLAIADEWDATLAKRVFSVIGAGGLVGATAGSAAAGLLLQVITARDLIVVASAILLVSAGAAITLLPASSAAPARRPPVQPAAPADQEGVWSNPYLLRLLLLVTTTQIAVTAASLLFKAVVADAVPAEQLASFFAFFYTGLNGLSLLVQLLLASWLLRRLGVSRVFWVLPVLLAVGALGFAATGALLPILLVKLVDGSLRHSLHRTGIELLYLPLPGRLRDRHKVTIDGAGARGGQAIASVALLAGMWLGLPLTDLALLVAGAVALLLISVIAIKRHYVELFRRQLREGTVEIHAETPELDLYSLEALIAALSSDADRVVLSALDLLEQNGRAKLVPPLILHHPSRDVVVRALDLLCASRRRDFLPLARRLLGSIDPEIRTAALRAVAMAGGADREETLRTGLVDPSPAVRATAIVALDSSHDAGGTSQEMAAVLERTEPDSRVALARAIHDRPDPAFHSILRRLAGAADRAVQVEVARAIADAPDASFVPLLLPMLGARQVRAEARAALVAIGEPALIELDRALGDPELPRRLRLHLPRTLSRFYSQPAADALCRHLERELDTSIGYKILRGLGRMIVVNPQIELDPGLLDRAIESVLHRAVTLVDWRLSMERERGPSTTAGGLLVALLREKEERCAERAFRLLGLRHPSENFEVIWDGLHSGDRKTAASARELIEYLLEARARAAVLALVDRGVEDDGDQMARAAALFRPASRNHVERLRAMMSDSCEALAGLAAHHVAELGIRGESLQAAGAAGQPVASRQSRWSHAARNRRPLGSKAGAHGVG